MFRELIALRAILYEHIKADDVDLKVAFLSPSMVRISVLRASFIQGEIFLTRVFGLMGHVFQLRERIDLSIHILSALYCQFTYNMFPAGIGYIS